MAEAIEQTPMERVVAQYFADKKAIAERQAAYERQNADYWSDCLTVGDVIEALGKLPHDARFAVYDDGGLRGLDHDNFAIDTEGSYTLVTV